MANKYRRHSQEKDKEAGSTEPDENTPVTFAKGGMSPLADRKDAKDWDKSVDAKPAGTGEKAAPGAPQRTPAEPVGGWVDASTGRGKILVPKGGKSEAVPGATDERTPMRLIKAKERDTLAALPPAESLARRLRDQEAKQKKDKAAAEAGARERQGENRNEQDAVREDEEDEEDEETDENA